MIIDFGYKWAHHLLRMNGTDIPNLVHGYTLAG